MPDAAGIAVAAAGVVENAVGKCTRRDRAVAARGTVAAVGDLALPDRPRREVVAVERVENAVLVREAHQLIAAASVVSVGVVPQSESLTAASKGSCQ